MKNIFEFIQNPKMRSNKFDLTHDVKMSAKMGELTPILVMDCVPGDRFKIATDTLLRYAPLIAPVMHRMDLRIEHFFCPYRLLWNHSDEFFTNQTTGGIPTITVSTALTTAQQRFLDYMGIPPIAGTGGISRNINCMPLMAYQKIYNDYYRDQNLITELVTDLSDGNQAVGIMATMRKRAFEHDFLTASLPTPQKGSGVSLPLGDVRLKALTTTNPKFVTVATHTPPAAGLKTVQTDNVAGVPEIDVNSVGTYAYDPNGTLETTPTTINDLRRAEKLQQFLEKLIRGGTRFIEALWSIWGVKSKDARLARPEYIVGVKTPIVVSEVLNTAGTFTGGTPTSPVQGSMAGHAVGVSSGNDGYYYCEEHGCIIGILSVMPKTGYQQGIPKHFLKTDPLDYFIPDFAHLGEQSVINDEVYAYEALATGTATFGYMPRYWEYKYINSRVAGDFRTTLKHWHLSRIFAAAPALNQTFIEADPTMFTRIFAVTTTDDNLYIHCLNKILARRPMPVFGTPQL